MTEQHLKLLRVINDKLNSNEFFSQSPDLLNDEVRFLLETIYVLLDNSDYLYQYYTELQQIQELNKLLINKKLK